MTVCYKLKSVEQPEFHCIGRARSFRSTFQRKHSLSFYQRRISMATASALSPEDEPELDRNFDSNKSSSWFNQCFFLFLRFALFFRPGCNPSSVARSPDTHIQVYHFLCVCVQRSECCEIKQNFRYNHFISCSSTSKLRSVVFFSLKCLSFSWLGLGQQMLPLPIYAKGLKVKGKRDQDWDEKGRDFWWTWHSSLF